MVKNYKNQAFIATTILTALDKCLYLPPSTPILSIISVKTATYMVKGIKRVKKAILEF